MPVKRKTTKQKKKSVALRRRRKSKLKKSIQKKVRSLLLAIMSVGLATVLGLGYGAYKFVNAPFSDASGLVDVDHNNIWIGNQTVILTVLVSDIDDPYSDVLKLKLVSLDGIAKKYSIYDIPVDTEVEYALNYGKGPLKRLYSVGNADQDRGVYALQKTIFKLLAVKPNGYIVMDKTGLTKIEDKLGDINEDDISASLRLRNLPNLPSSIGLIRTESLTNMKISDVFSIIDFFHKTSSTSSSYMHLNKYHLLDAHNWDSVWQDRFSASIVNQENVKVFVANDSSDPKIPGLAGWGGRVVKNIGADVLETQNSFVEFDENTIITEDLELETVKELSRIFDIDNIILVDSLDRAYGYNPQIFRAKISLILKSF